MQRYNDVLFTRTMALTYEENVLLTFFSKKRDEGTKQICLKYRRKKWSVSFVNDLLRKIDEAGSVERKASSGRPESVERNGISNVF